VAVEIERRFRVEGRPWEGCPSERIVQAYVAVEEGRAVRVRRRGAGATLTIKGPPQGTSRAEFEIPIAPELADEIATALALPGRISKTRYLREHGGHTWEIDVFDAPNDGLVIAEVELAAEGEVVDLPAWVRGEVTDDPRFTNAWLARHPWSTWDAAARATGLDDGEGTDPAGAR
jgi:CYTH domain-containing protein